MNARRQSLCSALGTVGLARGARLEIEYVVTIRR